MRNITKRMSKRLLSVLMSIAVMISVIVPALTVFDFTAAAAGDKLTVNADGSFRVLQVPDIQSKFPLPEDTVTMIETAIAKYKPNLIVMTGDNIVGCVNDLEFRNTADQIMSLFVDESGSKIPFAVTFGNHDTESNDVSDVAGWSTTFDHHTIKRMYTYFIEHGAIDFDYKFSPSDDVATGYIDVYNQAGSKVVRRIIIINSATYDDKGGYGKAGYNQSKINNTYTDETCYNSIVSKVNEWTSDSSITCLAFQHIPLREFYTSGILMKSSSGLSAQKTSDSSISGNYAPNTSNPTVSGYYKEPCSCSYSDTSALYKALAKDNMLGIFYGHDHGDTLVGKGTVYGKSLVQGYGGGLNTEWNGAGMAALRYMTITSGGDLNTDYYTSKSSDSNFINKDEYETFGRKFTSTAGKYISDITAKGHEKWGSAIDQVTAAGFTAITANVNVAANSGGEVERADLNKGCGKGSPYIVMGYKTTTDVNNAIRDIKVVIQNHNTLSDTILVNGMTYKLANTAGVYDLNQDGGGSYIYLYYTTDRRAGAPITDLGVVIDRYGDVAEAASSVGKSFPKPYQVVRNSQEPNMSGTSNQTVANMNDGTNATKMYVVMRSTETDLTKEYLALCEAMRTYGAETNSVLYTADSWSKYSTAKNLVYNYIKHFNEGTAAPGTVSSDDLKNAAKNLKDKYNGLEKEQLSSNDQAIATSSAIGGVKLAFPETIYLKVSSGKATQAQYYLNNKIEGGKLVPDGTTSSTGKFEVQVSSDNVKQIKIQPYRVESITESNGKITGATYYGANFNIFYMKANITTGSNPTWYYGENNLYQGVNAAPLNNKVSGEIIEGWCHLFGGENGSESEYGLSAGETALIEWRVDVDKQVNLAGDVKTVTQTYYAYTTVYAPMNHSIGAITETSDYNGSNSKGRNGQTSFSSWISGVQGLASTQVSFGANAHFGTPVATGKGTYVQDPILDLGTVKYKGILDSPGAIKLPLGSFINISSSAGSQYVNATTFKYYGKKNISQGASAVRSTTGSLNIDTSRYTNLSQIPNLYTGIDMIGSYYHSSHFDDTDSHLYGFYSVSGTTNASSPTWGGKGTTAMSTSTLNGITGSTWTQYVDFQSKSMNMAPNITYGKANTSVGSCRQLLKYGDANNAGVRVYNNVNYSWSKGSTAFNGQNLYTAMQARNYDMYSSATCIVKLGAANKDSMRQYIGDCTNAGLQEKWDRSRSNYQTFKYALMKAYKDLGDPTSLTTSTSSLSSAFTSCKNTQLTKDTVHSYDRALIRQINAATGTSNTWSTTNDISNLAGVVTETEVKIENWFRHNSTSIEGYALIGNKPTTALANIVSTNTASGLGLVTDKNIYEYEYAVDALDYLDIYYYYSLPDYTLTIDLNGGTGINYTSVIGNPGSTLTLPTVSRNGYTFSGWTLTGAGSPTNGKQNMTYTFGRGNAKLTANWVANPQNLIIDSNGGRYTGNLLYTSVNTSLSGGSSSSITWNIKSGNDSFEVSGSYAGGASERTAQIPMWCYLKYNQTYRITFTSSTPYSELYLFKDGSATVRNAFTVTSSTLNQNGMYVYTADFTVGVTQNTDCTWVGNQNTTGNYQIRLDQNSSDGGDYTVSGLRIEELTESVGSDVYIIQTTDSTRYVPTPKRDGYQFKGWTITPTDNNSRISGTTYTYGWSDTTLVANWQETTVSYDVNHDNINVNLYAPHFKTKEINGITYSYDPETDVITLNGTASQNAVFGITPFVPEAGSSYRVSIEKVSGTTTRSGSACLVFEAKDANGYQHRLNQGTDTKLGNFFVNDFNSGASANWSFTSAQVNSGNYKTLGLWVWTDTGASITFTDYKIKVKVEKSGSSTEFSPNTHYVLDSGTGLFPEVSRTNYTLLGWSRDPSSDTPTYTVGQNAIFKEANTKLYAIWLETATSNERVENVSVVKGITITNTGSSKYTTITESKKKYEYVGDAGYTKVCEAYETALSNFAKQKNTTTAEELYNARKALDSYNSGTFAYNSPIKNYVDNFAIRYASGVVGAVPASENYSIKNMNLNYYSTTTLDDTLAAYNKADGVTTYANQKTVNDNVALMAYNLAFSMENVKTSKPAFKVYDTETGAVNYVYPNKNGYTYYCYTNNPTPNLRITVDDVKDGTSGRICYPTKAETSDITVSNAQGITVSNAKFSVDKMVSATNTDSNYSKYLTSKSKLGSALGDNYYSQKQEISLSPVFTKNQDASVVYTIKAHDDSLTRNYASTASLSGIQTHKANATAANTITIVIDYHGTTSTPGSSNSFCATGAQVDFDKHLNQYHLFRSSGGAQNWELPKIGEAAYTVNDGTYGQTDYGSFTYTFVLGSSDNFANGVLSTKDTAAVAAKIKNNYAAMKSLKLTSAKTGTGSTAGLGYGVWGNNWSYNYYPKTGAYTYVHLVDRWGNVFDKVFFVGPQDYAEIKSQSNGNGYTLIEDGGSGIDTLSLNAAGYEILTDNDSTLENGVYRTTGNTIRIKTGAANTSCSIKMTDKATNSSTATLVSDENGIITLSIEDTAYKSGVYTFMLDGTEINLYDGVETSKYIKEVYSDEAEEGEVARLTVITTGEVSKTRITDADGNTITNNVYTEREDGTREFVFERKLAAGTYSYKIEAKSGKVWYDEGKTGVLTFTEKVLASGVIKAAEYDAATGLCKVTVEGRAGKVQIVSADGSTRTYTRYHKSVTNITSYDANGAEVSDTSRELDTEVWTLNVKLTGTNYTVVGKFEAGWNRTDTATKELVINK